MRHYHQLGLLPEPERLSNGYRRCTPWIRERRQRLRSLLDAGELPAEGPVSPLLAGLLAALPGSDSSMAAKDRGVPALIDTGRRPRTGNG